jgi:GDP-L-fucose synthase
VFKQSKIYVAGHNGLLGSAIMRALRERGYTNILFKRSKELDLRDQSAVNVFFERENPEYVFFSAGTVGGIMANIKYPADFIFDNLAMIVNVLHAARKVGVKKLVYFASSCMYPKESLQPIKEEYLLTGPLEETNKAYAISKIAGTELCFSFNKQYGTDYIVLMPTNLFGVGDNYHSENSHLVAALVRKIHEAKTNHKEQLQLWGTGNPRREILSSEAAADAAMYFMDQYSGNEVVNIGLGVDYTIREIAEMIKGVVGYPGQIVFDSTKPDGMMKKQLDVSRARNLGWVAKNNIIADIQIAYLDFQEHYQIYCTDKV